MFQYKTIAYIDLRIISIKVVKAIFFTNNSRIKLKSMNSDIDLIEDGDDLISKKDG